MKVLFINHEKNIGGAAKSLLGIISEMNAKNVECVVLTPYRTGLFVEECHKNNIELITVRFFSCILQHYNSILEKWVMNIVIFFLSYCYNFIVSVILSVKIKRLNIDLIHTNSSVINIGCFISFFLKLPQVIHFREFVEEDFFWDFVPSKKAVMSLYANNSIAQIFISDILRKKYLSYFKREDIHLIYNGVSIADLCYSERKTDCFLCVGRIVPGKRQLDLVNAVDILVNDMGLKNIYVDFAGSGDKQYLKKINETISQKKLNNNIHLLGYCTNINEIRRNYKYEIVCSQKEAFGRVVIEAMLSRNIVIAPDSGAFPELIDNGINGLLYTSGDIEDLIKCILKCLNSEIDEERMVEVAYKIADEKFSRYENACKIYDLYRNIIDKKEGF